MAEVQSRDPGLLALSPVKKSPGLGPLGGRSCAITLPAHPPPPSPCPRADDAILQGSIIGSERLAVRPDFLSQIQFLFQVPQAYE